MEEAKIISMVQIIRLVTVSFLLSCSMRFAEIIRAATVSALMVSWGHGKNNSTILILAIVAASALFIWDYILTFGMEIDLVWKSKWNLMKGLYLFQRYLPFIDTVWLVLYRQPDAFSISLPWLFFSRSNGGEFDEDCMSKYILRQWRFVRLTLAWSRRIYFYESSTNDSRNCCIRE